MSKSSFLPSFLPDAEVTLPFSHEIKFAGTQVLVTGSLYLVGDVLKMLERHLAKLQWRNLTC